MAHESALPIAYADQNTYDINYYPGEEYCDGDFESEQMPIPEPIKENTRSMVLGFQPPSDRHLHGVRARKSRGKKAMLRAMGADG